ncbi:MAG TPA: hypothetical protein VFR11_01055 [Micromonosporaceae bacterium]|nr:hypothetical protein [Micromonosporaceae bacterium]
MQDSQRWGKTMGNNLAERIRRAHEATNGHRTASDTAPGAWHCFECDAVWPIKAHAVVDPIGMADLVGPCP